MKKIKEYLDGNIYVSLIYRILIVYLLYTLTRAAFLIYNYSLFSGLDFKEIFHIFTGGLVFDTSAIVYTNILFVILYLVPFKFRHHKTYQRILMYVFFITNGIALVANCADIPYYKFVLKRTTMDFIGQFKHEQNLWALTFKFLIDFWQITVFWILMMLLMVWLYLKVKVNPPKIKSNLLYTGVGLVMLAVFSGLSVAGARGGFRHSTRPITLSNAGQYVTDPNNMSIVLNTPFTLIQTIEAKPLQKEDYFTSDELEKIYSPLHTPNHDTVRKDNVVIFIIESFNKEFIGSLNKDLDNGHYEGYTPFIDSLIPHSLVFQHSYANGRKSIDAIPSVLTGIPSIKRPFILTTYFSDDLNSLPGLLKQKGYKSAFFHGAPNGSMGFLAFTNIIGVDEYYGKDEYNNNADFDGIWGIWDEEFMQYYANQLDTFKQPFVAALFSVSSHHPFKLPERYKDRFKGDDFPLQKCIRYTDYSLRRFFQTASKMPWFKNTLFVITADHVSLNQRPEYKNDVGYFSIPIIFYKPGSDLVGVDSVTNAQQIDIMPTILDYLGYDKDYIAFGKDLFHTRRPNFTINYLNGTYRLFLNNYLLISDGNKPLELYNVVNDRQVSANIMDQHPEQTATMMKFMKAFIQQYNNRLIENRMVPGR